MKIAVVVPGGVDPSGERRVIPALLALLGRLATQHEVHVYALRQQVEPGDWTLVGARIHNIGGRHAPLTLARAVGAIVREHGRSRFAFVQAIWSGHSGLVAVATARLLGVPCAVHVAGGELVALHDIGYGGRSTWRGRAREAWVLGRADRITAASQPMLEQLAALGYPAQRLPLGVDLRVWPPRAPQARAAQDTLRLAQVASLNRVKDQTCLLQALALLLQQGVDAELDLIGEDTRGVELQALAQRLGLTARVRFHGFLTQGALRPVLARAHVHIISSRHEAGPLAVLEAAVLGVPSIGTAVGHLAEWAPQAALVVQPGDAAGLAASLALLARDDTLRMRLAVEAQGRALAEDAAHTHRLFAQLHAELVCAAS